MSDEQVLRWQADLPHLVDALARPSGSVRSGPSSTSSNADDIEVSD